MLIRYRATLRTSLRPHQIHQLNPQWTLQRICPHALSLRVARPRAPCMSEALPRGTNLQVTRCSSSGSQLPRALSVNKCKSLERPRLRNEINSTHVWLEKVTMLDIFEVLLPDGAKCKSLVGAWRAASLCEGEALGAPISLARGFVHCYDSVVDCTTGLRECVVR